MRSLQTECPHLWESLSEQTKPKGKQLVEAGQQSQ